MEVDYELPGAGCVTDGNRPVAAPAATKTSQLRLRVHDVAIRVARSSPAGDLWATAEVAFTPSPERAVREQMREVLAAVETELELFVRRRSS